MLIIYIDLDNKNLVSIELNLPSCLQVKKRKTWMISLCLSFKEAELVNSGNRLVWATSAGHRDSENGTGGGTCSWLEVWTGVVYIISLAYIMLMWILSGWNIDRSFIGLFSGISQYSFFIKSLIKCPEICQNNFIDLELHWNTLITFIISWSSRWHISYKYSHLKSDMINIQASKEGWHFLSQGHEKYFSYKHIVITSNSCKEANCEKKISFKNECQWFCESWPSLSFSLAVITSSWRLWLGLP